MELIKCENLSMAYEGVTAVNNISFTLDEGDYLCILGENGSGKSTLIKGILGLKQSTSGSIEFKGIKQRQIGYLPQQNALQKDFPATVQEVILSGCLNSCGWRPFYGKKQKQVMEECIEHLHLNPIRKKSFRDLSGGQQQRVLIARALCATDKLLLLDEPVTGLDPIVTIELYELIKHLNQAHGVSVIMISHDVDSAIKYSNKILHVTRENSFFGTTEEYLKTDIYKNMIGGNLDVGCSC